MTYHLVLYIIFSKTKDIFDFLRNFHRADFIVSPYHMRTA